MLTSHDVSSLVIDTLCDRASQKNIAVAGFYLDFISQKEQSAAGVLGALLKQIIGGLEEVPIEIVKVYRHQKNLGGGRGPRLLELVKMLRTVSSSQCTFLCVDALDECTERCQLDVLDSLQMILQGSPGTRLFLTGRVRIMDAVRRRFHNGVAVACISPREEDITQYLRARLDEDTTPGAMDRSLRTEILRIIPEIASEMWVVATGLGPYLKLSANGYISSFTLVPLSIGAILQEPTIHRRRQRLNAMANGLSLGDAYGATVQRIKAQRGTGSKLGMAALMWVSHSERPLRVDELCHALAVEIGSADLDPENVPSIKTLLRCCKGLLTVDKEASTVRLTHLTLQEYLSTYPDLFAGAHSTIAETCLTYLNFQRFKSPPTGDLSDPFLGYSSIYWGIHAKRELSDSAKSLALGLFDNYNDHVSAQFLLKHVSNPNRFDGGWDFSLFTGLHCASLFGIVGVVAALVEMEGCDVNQRDCVGNTPLIWAAESGYEGVVRLLLEREEINPDKLDDRGQTPLSRAAENGHEGVTRLLLEREEVNPDKPDNRGQTPLSRAAKNGHGGVARLLLEWEEVNPDKPDKRGQTPLSRAAENGHEGVAKLLLEREEVNPDMPDNRGQTPLSQAAKNGHAGVAKLLLEREEVNPDKPDNRGQTPLSRAAENGHGGVAKLLLEREEVNPDKPDYRGQTPLTRAAGNGCEGVVELLLQREDVRADQPDYEGLAPLSWAVKNGQEGVVRLLLKRKDVDPDRPDGMFGQTPLSSAVENGYEGIVRLLLERSDVDPDRQDKILGHTPLLWAAENGYEGVVRLLLERDNVDPDRYGNDGRTPLSRAAWNGHEGVVKLLLERSDVDPGRPDTEGQTPFLGASRNCHEGVVKLLLGRDDVDLD